MNNLTHELREQHKWLVSQLTSLQADPGSPQAGQTLKAVQKGLVAHLQKEDGRLYPTLRNVGQKDPKVREVSEMFDTEMKKITTAAVAFFDTYVQPGATQSPKFVTDLEGLVKVLAARISSEEMVLYPTYDRVAFGEADTVNPPREEPAKKQGSNQAAIFWAGGAIALLGAVAFAVLT